MIELVLSVAVFALACMTLLLFAMVGELASRIDSGSPSSSSAATLEPLEGLDGVEIHRWPEGHVRHEDPHIAGVVVVLTTVCSSCRAIGERLAATRDWLDSSRIEMVVVAGPTEQAVHEYQADTGFDGFVADVGNRWTQGVVGIATAPSAFEVGPDGAVGRAVTFANVDGLQFFANDLPSESIDASAALRNGSHAPEEPHERPDVAMGRPELT